MGCIRRPGRTTGRLDLRHELRSDNHLHLGHHRGPRVHSIMPLAAVSLDIVGQTGAGSGVSTGRWAAAHLAVVTSRWFTDEDREDMRRAKEARQVLDELCFEHAREGGVQVTPAMLRVIDGLQIDPSRRRK